VRRLAQQRHEAIVSRVNDLIVPRINEPQLIYREVVFAEIARVAGGNDVVGSVLSAT